MTALRTLVDTALAEVLNEHPKYFTPRGKDHFRTTALRKIMAAFRDATKENESGESRDESATPVIRDVPLFVEPTSTEGVAYATLCKAGGAVSPLIIGGRYRIPACAALDSVWRFAEVADLQSWRAVSDKRQVAAWLGFFSETLAGVNRAPIVKTAGDLTRYLYAPWPWPPCKDGSLSHQQEMEPVDEDEEESIEG